MVGAESGVDTDCGHCSKQKKKKKKKGKEIENTNHHSHPDIHQFVFTLLHHVRHTHENQI